MSHVAETKTLIRAVNPTILQAAVELFLKANPGYNVKTSIGLYEGGHQNVDIAVQHPSKLSRGIGINFKGTDGMKFIGDSWNVSGEYNRVQQLLVQTYQAVAVQTALQGMNYTVTAVNEGSKVRLEAQRA